MRKVQIPVPGGDAPGVLLEVKSAKAAVVLAHGAGGDMRAPLLVAMTEGLRERGFTTLRFDFLYRAKGKKVPDRAPVLESTWRAVIAFMRGRAKRIVIGGKSMGGRYATIVAAQGEPCDGVLLLGYPLHPPNKPEKLRDAHLTSVKAPMLFLQGTRDPLCELGLLRPVLAKVGKRATLHVVEGGDHSLDLPKAAKTPRDVVHAELLETIEQWLRRAVVASALS
jgi:predicted alpha/beta-hydrolase family hydrolase